MADLAVKDLPDLGSKPADAQYIVRSDGTTPKEGLLSDELMFDGYSKDDEAADLENKTLTGSCVVGDASDQVPISASEVQIGTSGSLFTYIKYARGDVVVPAILAGASGEVNVTIAGAAITDMVFAQFSESFLDALTMQARVTASNTVTLRFTNHSAGNYAGATLEFDVLVVRLANV